MEALTKRKYSQIVLTGISLFQTSDIFLMSSDDYSLQREIRGGNEVRKRGAVHIRRDL
jgi:hypothetical protein